MPGWHCDLCCGVQVAQFKADLSRAHTVMNEKVHIISAFMARSGPPCTRFKFGAFEQERRVIEAESKEKVLQEELESVKHTMEMTQAELRQFKVCMHSSSPTHPWCEAPYFSTYPCWIPTTGAA